jgi:pyridoxine/pyridoxamine 5'-phosphate oxidase
VDAEKANPFDLFRMWFDEARAQGVVKPQMANLATSDG